MENTNTAEQKRPTFLTVLGILSFIGCALQLLGSLAIIGSLAGILSLISAIACFIGVLMMWKLKKMGFWIYAIFELLPPVYTLIAVGSVAFKFGAYGGGFMAYYTVLSMFFPVLFVILYGLNLKHLK